MNRRNFLGTTLGASALAALSAPRTIRGAESASAQEYYELRVYHLAPESDGARLHSYLEKALIPGLNRIGIKPVGVFGEIEPKDGKAVHVLIPYATLDTFASVNARLGADSAYQKAGAEHLGSPKSDPAFTRIESSLMLAFAGLPRMDLPVWSREKRPRIFELRTYESHSEPKAAKKVEMFNAGEVEIMRDVGLGPIFFGQTLVGGSLPNLVYMVSGENREDHKKHWGGFGAHPIWNKLKNDPQYADTVSKIRNVFLAPAAYSQI
jgi:hypothetical protein